MQTKNLLSVATLSMVVGAMALVGCSSESSSLSRSEFDTLSTQFLNERKTQLAQSLAQEWNAHEWTNGEYRMKFWDTIYGPTELPEGGRSLYISLHGGGGAPAEVNDQQWENQKVLYTPAEGLYFVPRSPTDTWNMWHQEYMDEFLRKTIAAAVVFEGVNPDKVYILGYSAGGDGLYQMAPRMADHWAAASMMAGHPGDARMESLRNLPFAIYMGGQDAAYDRNLLAKKYSTILDSLAAADGKGGYIHDTHIYDDCGHWMLRRDTIAIPWMAQYTRNTYPKRVVWVQDDVLRDNFYWLGVPSGACKQGATVAAEIDGQTLCIDTCEVPVLLVGLNDAMLNLDEPVTVKMGDKTLTTQRFTRKAPSAAQLLNPSPYSLDAPYPVVLQIARDAQTGDVTVVER